MAHARARVCVDCLTCLPFLPLGEESIKALPVLQLGSLVVRPELNPEEHDALAYLQVLFYEVRYTLWHHNQQVGLFAQLFKRFGHPRSGHRFEDVRVLGEIPLQAKGPLRIVSERPKVLLERLENALPELCHEGDDVGLTKLRDAQSMHRPDAPHRHRASWRHLPHGPHAQDVVLGAELCSFLPGLQDLRKDLQAVGNAEAQGLRHRVLQQAYERVEGLSTVFSEGFRQLVVQNFFPHASLEPLDASRKGVNGREKIFQARPDKFFVQGFQVRLVCQRGGRKGAARLVGGIHGCLQPCDHVLVHLVHEAEAAGVPRRVAAEHSLHRI
mmetsp:Transcript_10889/g.30629  ORF Transcript_10889/g.30629 Transcript_10889/m.30629 type:complete len:327 (+) Transcript_10889:1542-2522(+)